MLKIYISIWGSLDSQGYGMPNFLLLPSLPQNNQQVRGEKADFPCSCAGGMSPVCILGAPQTLESLLWSMKEVPNWRGRARALPCRCLDRGGCGHTGCPIVTAAALCTTKAWKRWGGIKTKFHPQWKVWVNSNEIFLCRTILISKWQIKHKHFRSQWHLFEHFISYVEMFLS